MVEVRQEVFDHWMILRCGVKIWNLWRKANPETRPDLERAKLENAELGSINLKGANLWGARLGGANLMYADLEGANLMGANLGGALLGDANLGGADLGGANLEGAELEHADLRDAKLVRADLAGAKLGNASLEHADLGNANLMGAKLTHTYFGGAKLEGANLGDADLEGADLVCANLKQADLGGADLLHARLEGADLRGTNFAGAELVRAKLEGANLEGANLWGTNLWDAHLKDAYFTRKTYLHSTLFLDVDLREVKGLEELEHHYGPSLVSSQTLQRNQGQLPEKFLKGCGFKDWEILAAKLHDPSLRPDEVTDIAYRIDQVRGESPIVPLSVFISYTRKDQGFVEKVEQQFDKDGIRSWRDVHDVVSGPLEAQVDRAIGLQRVTLLVLSEDSVKSDWVEWEATRAREVEQERDGQYVLCPVALDDSWKTCKWPKRVQTQIEKYAILDFSRWGSDSEFGVQYEKLKTGLGIYYADKGPGPT